MRYKEILFDVRDRIATITLDRQESLNAFSDAMREEMKDCIDRIEGDAEVRVVVITGAGKAFCAGGDVKAMLERAKNPVPFQEKRDFYRKRTGDTVRRLRSISQPVIAAINGAAVGAGCSLALACDMRIASEKARLGLVFARRGLSLDYGGAYFLPRLIGTARAMELACTGKLIDAQTALQMGLVNSVVPHGELESRVKALCDEIAQNAPLAVSAIKKAIYCGMTYDLEQALEYEAYIQSMCELTEDHREGALAFVEKRPPVFKGK
jgi:2-(1,2-epoxy-1,2-dihydrophenyl)acetyl-CoA isomerase